MAIYNYDTEKIMRSIPKVMRHYQDGDIAVISSEHKVYTYQHGDWTIPKTGVDVSLMDLNEQIMSQQPNMTDFTKFKEDFNKFITDDIDLSYVLIQHDYHYITIFLKNNDANISLYDGIMECIKNIGPIKGYDIYTGSHIEIWIETPKGVKMFILFPYEEGMVYYHG